jgi:hypothetical protein
VPHTWWNEHVFPFCKKGYLPIKHAKKIRTLLATAELADGPLEDWVTEKIMEKPGRVASPPPDGWTAYRESRRQSLLALLD